MTNKFRGKTAAVVGIGRSNIPLAEFLCESGAVVTARDSKERDYLEPAATQLEEKGVKLILGDGYLSNLNEDYIFRSPGIRYDKPEFVAACAKGSKLTSEMELFFELCPAKIIGITGSDGKTTTTTLISLILSEVVKERGVGKVYLGGNIGRPLIPYLHSMTQNDFAVVELSSFQLHTMKRSPQIAVMTNVTPNHLDYHLNMEEYIDAKRNVYLHQKAGGRLVLNFSNEITKLMAKEAASGVEVIPFCGEYGVTEDGGIIRYFGQPVLKTSDIMLVGRHNVENFMAAIGAVFGIADTDMIYRVATTFGGVEHRNEFVREVSGVKYYNSSIDSSPTRTNAALASYDRKVIIICGGYDKLIPMEPLAAPLCERAKAVVLTGATAKKIRASIESCGLEPPLLIERPVFEDAVLAARDLAQDGDIVLLSPACASFDAFPNFEVRGNTFKSIVRSF